MLHVGVGNSGLARRFYSSLGRIDGITATPAEQALARSLGLERYGCILHNKFCNPPETLRGGYDFILDNNLTTYACCLGHFADLMKAYCALLADSGQIVTDRQGLMHLLSGRKRLARFAFDFADLAAVAPLFGLTAFNIDGSVHVLSRSQPPAPRLAHKLRFLRNRLRDKVVP